MIRLFTALCKIILENHSDYDLFLSSSAGFNHFDKRCPGCGSSAGLFPYGSYTRSLVTHEDGNTKDYSIRPTRYKCKICGTTHALLPDIVTPHSPYSLFFKLTALAAYYERDITVDAVCLSFGIAVSTLYEWKKRLHLHKALLVGALANLKTPALTFIRSLMESVCLSDQLGGFFQKYAFSFLQGPKAAATQSYPP